MTCLDYASKCSAKIRSHIVSGGQNVKLKNANLRNEEQRKIKLRAQMLMEKNGIFMAQEEDMYRKLRKTHGYVGYADYYLQQCYEESKLINNANIKIYSQLLKIDSQLGTNSSEQLFKCLYHSVRQDLVEVFLKYFFDVKFILGC